MTATNTTNKNINENTAENATKNIAKSTKIHPLTALIKDDMKPALGVTEPGAIAYAVSTARSYVKGDLVKVKVASNSGIYKNAFTCGIPGSDHFGNTYSAALGAIAGDPDLVLECLANVTPEDNKKAEELVENGMVETTMSELTSRIHIEATVETTEGTATVTIYDTHTNIVSITVNGETVFSKDTQELKSDSEAENENSNAQATSAENAGDASKQTSATDGDDAQPTNEPLHEIHKYTLEQIVEYADTVPAEEIAFVMSAVEMNMQLFKAATENDRTVYLHHLIKRNGGKIESNDELTLANLYSDGAIEARVLGFPEPAMSITGSGSHGIITTLPLYAVKKIHDISDEKLTRAIAISYLVCMYIKEYSGKLSAFCGCGIAGGTGVACGLVYLWGGGASEMAKAITNMAGSITGMICDGGNHGCTLKSITACNMAFESAWMAMDEVAMDGMHGISGLTPEDTMRNMGLIASPGMVATEKTIVEIMENK